MRTMAYILLATHIASLAAVIHAWVCIGYDPIRPLGILANVLMVPTTISFFMASKE